jgi:predicted metal-binding membrane protein
MVVLIAVGVMNIAVMAGLAAVIFLEKLWRRGPLLSRAVGVAFIAIAVIAVFRPEVLPGLHASMGDAGMGAGMGMG